MSCKYKDSKNAQHCTVIDGECQFMKNGYDDLCPILEQYRDLDKYLKKTASKNDEK